MSRKVGPGGLKKAAYEGCRMAPHVSGEAVLINHFKLWAGSFLCKDFPDGLNFNPETDTIVYEMALRSGRADIVIFHASGGISLIEAKDGAKGVTHVTQGIGQAILYSTQLSIGSGSFKRVKPFLLWGASGDDMDAALILISCAKAGVTPICWPSANTLKAASSEAMKALEAHG